MKFKNITGMVFGKLTALERVDEGGKAKWLCACSCGSTKVVYSTHLIRGNSKSCGTCLGAPVKSMPAHQSWVSMVARCTYPNHEAYHRYGGRGIRICESWIVFANFLKDMGHRPEGKTLDRIDSNGNYEPSNCKWSTPKEQQNNISSNRLVEFNGELVTIAMLADATGVKYQTLYSQINRKLEKACIAKQ